MSDDTTLVRYVRNADERATGAIAFPDDDRDDLAIGGVGYMTTAEISRAAAYGVLVEPISEADARELGWEPPSQEKPLEELSKAELEEIAAAEGIDLSGARSNADKAARIQEARAGQSEGEGSLPATATRGPGGPVSSGALAGSGTTTSVSTAGTGGPAT